MLTNLSNKLASAFGASKPPRRPSKLVEWPDDVTVPGVPLFTTYLTDADLDALQESAGLGPPSWWLDPVMAETHPQPSSPTYEEEVALTAWLREPFEQAGPIREASRGLLDRLNDLERLQALALEENERKLLGKARRVRHHSTLLLTTSTEDLSQPEPRHQQQKVEVKSPVRRDTYAVHKQAPVTSSPNAGQRNLANPRFCKSPERRDINRSETQLHRTYSKHSLDRLQVGDALQRNNNYPASLLSENSTNALGRTYDAENMSDVFPSPRASIEASGPSRNPPPPPTPSTELPRAMPSRLHTYNSTPKPNSLLNNSRGSSAVALALQQEVNLRASVSKLSGGYASPLRGSGASGEGPRLVRGDTLVPRSSDSPVRSGHQAGAASLRDSLPTRLSTEAPPQHKFSAPAMPGAVLNPSLTSLHKSGSGSNIIPTNMNETIALARLQELELRASSGRSGDVNSSISSSVDEVGGREEDLGRLNKSLPVLESDGNCARMFAQREVKDIPTRYDPERKRSVGSGIVTSNSTGELSRNKSGSQSSLKDMASVVELVRSQAESLRASGEQVMQKSRSKSSLTRSVESLKTFSQPGSGSVSRDASPQPPPIPSKGEPVQHQDNADAGALRDSGATYNLAQSADPARASISSLQSSNVTPPRQSASPVTMRRSARSNIPPPLVLPTHTDEISPGSKGGTPNTANTVRPSSYIDQLHSAKHASSAVEAWVDDTMAVDPENPAVHLSESGESITVTSITESGVRDSAETYALPDRPAPAPPPPQPVKQPVPLAEPAKWPNAVRPSGLPRPSGLRAPIPRLVKAPRSLMSASSSENVMTTSQRTVTANTTKPTPLTRRALAPTAIPAGGRAGTASGVIGAERPRGTALRPPTATRLRTPASTAPPASRLAQPTAARRAPETKPKLASLARNATRGAGSNARGPSSRPPPPEY